MWASMMIAPHFIARLFTDDTQLIQLTGTGMRIMFCTSLFIGMQMVNQNAFVALGNTRYSFLFGIMRKLLFLLPLALILPLMFGIWGIYMAEAVSNLLTTMITYIFFSRYMKRYSLS